MGGGEKIICEETAKVKKREEEDFSPFISRTIFFFSFFHSIYRMCAQRVCDVCVNQGGLIFA